MKKLALILSLGAAGACSDSPDFQLNLNVGNACNHQALTGSDYIQVQVTSPELDDVITTTWDLSAQGGELPDIPPMTDTIVTVLGRVENNNGEPGRAAFSTSVGLLDLTQTGSDDVFDLSVAMGVSDGFMSTTNTVTGGQCSALAADRYGHTATTLREGAVLVVGGESLSAGQSQYWVTTEIYDPRSGRFTRGPDLEDVRRAHTATLLQDGRVLIAGGLWSHGTTDIYDHAIIFDPTTSELSAPIWMGGARAHHTATLLADGRVLLVGGQDSSGPLSTSVIFVPEQDAFVDGPPLAASRMYHAAVLMNDSVVAVLGGQDASGLVDRIEYVATGRGQTFPGALMDTPRIFPMAARLPGESAVVVMGGYEAATINPQTTEGSSAFEVLRWTDDPLLAQVVCTELQLSSPRGLGAVAELPNALLVVGGVTSSADISSDAELVGFNDVDACDAVIRPTATGLGIARAAPVASTLAGGDVLITGGFSRDGGGQIQTEASTEIYVRQR